jgi:hypothetical protein
MYLDICATAPSSLRFRSRFIPVRSISMAVVARTTYRTTFLTAVFLSLFSAIPGLRLCHHFGAAVFAFSAATWCACGAIHSHAVAQASQITSPAIWRRVYCKYALSGLQFCAWICFGALWILIKLGIPFRLVPNTDRRFVVLALLEYAATVALLIAIRLAAGDIVRKSLVLSLASV